MKIKAGTKENFYTVEEEDKVFRNAIERSGRGFTYISPVLGTEVVTSIQYSCGETPRDALKRAAKAFTRLMNSPGGRGRKKTTKQRGRPHQDIIRSVPRKNRRDELIEFFKEQETKLSAKEVLRKLPNRGQAEIYRSLKALTDVGELQRENIGGTYRYWRE